MIVTLENGLRFDAGKPIDISIPLRFDGPQPGAYGVEPASAEACEYGDLVGDTRRGGSCNFERVTLIPHCNGTHTECVGHITHVRSSVLDRLRDVLAVAVLVSIEPTQAVDSGETYAAETGDGDTLITRAAIQASLRTVRTTHPDVTPSALIVRSLPNGEAKLSRKYDEDSIPPFFSTEAMRYIFDLGFRHLLVDMPSVDRLYDTGKLSNHRIFWNLASGSFEARGDARVDNTITELTYVPDDVADGLFVLNLQIAPFMSDASPSRPVLFSIE